MSGHSYNKITVSSSLLFSPDFQSLRPLLIYVFFVKSLRIYHFSFQHFLILAVLEASGISRRSRPGKMAKAHPTLQRFHCGEEPSQSEGADQGWSCKLGGWMRGRGRPTRKGSGKKGVWMEMLPPQPSLEPELHTGRAAQTCSSVVPNQPQYLIKSYLCFQSIHGFANGWHGGTVIYHVSVKQSSISQITML